VPEGDPERHPRQAQHRIVSGSAYPAAARASSRVTSGHSSLTASAARPAFRAVAASRMTEVPNASMTAKSALSGPAIPSM
jgi:hypothetical protein